MHSNRSCTHVSCTARLFPRITEQKNKLREWKQKHLAKAARHSKEDTSKMKRRPSGVRLFHFARPSCDAKPRSQGIWRAGGKELWSSPAGGGPTWQRPEVVRRDKRWRCYCSVPQKWGISPTSGCSLRGHCLLMAPGHNSWQFVSVWLQNIPMQAGWCQAGLEFQERIFVAPATLFFPKGLEVVSELGLE